ncbi:MAG: 2-C-methyl-D-erythritol 4-phosphate cytidylyltransferase [Methanobacteriaceae archaeon]|uniref:IspD/TarI family cytidylyltransferase n=1 Tax=Methanobrevibacter TaxID=2172 RepID=UPI002A0DF21A|nr:2-C-methyl-D-erythritol 4-phosphate cytidylyltransferase [Methanobacteriaceae archaeon]MDD3408803.1 2-C-methyl-D-erythritol 4-phosphate cytidylyltransferase [Methanobacteriaceae archaeon]MDD4595042.1 2-C-methyl-D-erythritol 4-phosphate cytidylyltransferase [Methanobacteriaceae archaeon]
MIFAAILAGGTGIRMGNVDKPKQFLFLGNKPIIIHTIEKFYINPNFNKIIVLCPKQWINYTKDLINKYIKDNQNIIVIEAGNVRNETIMKAINYIESNFSINSEDIIVTHDSVRPFVTHRIIEDNINAVIKYGACDTIIPASDTIVQSLNGQFVSDIPNRINMYQGQTPQSFKILKLKELYNKLSNNEKSILTDAAKIFIMNNEDVFLVNGEVTNIKITYPYDLKVANSILNEE